MGPILLCSSFVWATAGERVRTRQSQPACVCVCGTHRQFPREPGSHDLDCLAEDRGNKYLAGKETAKKRTCSRRKRVKLGRLTRLPFLPLVSFSCFFPFTHIHTTTSNLASRKAILILLHLLTLRPCFSSITRFYSFFIFILSLHPPYRHCIRFIIYFANVYLFRNSRTKLTNPIETPT